MAEISFRAKPTPQGFGAQNWEQVARMMGTIMGEAKDEPAEGKAKIADVVKNRTTEPFFSDKFGTEPWEQMAVPSQFNTWQSDKSASNAIARDVYSFVTSPQFAKDPLAAIARYKWAGPLSETLYALHGVFGSGELAGIAGGSQYYSNPEVVRKSSSAGNIKMHENLGMNAPGVMKTGLHEFYGKGSDQFHTADSSLSGKVFDSLWHGVTNPYTDKVGLTSSLQYWGGNDTPVEMRNSGGKFLDLFDQPSLFGNESRALDLFGGSGEYNTLNGVPIYGIGLAGNPKAANYYENAPNWQDWKNYPSQGYTPKDIGKVPGVYYYPQYATEDKRTFSSPNYGYGGRGTGYYTPFALTTSGYKPFPQGGYPMLTGVHSTMLSGGATEWADYPAYGGSQGGDTMGGHAGWFGAWQRMQDAIAKAQQNSEQQRAETDANIASNAGIANAYNPQYNPTFDENIAKQNPTTLNNAAFNNMDPYGFTQPFQSGFL